MTCLEDLSNEILYETIEYLDICDAYEAFWKLNYRFQHLFNYLSLPLKLNINVINRNSLQECCQNIKTNYFDRIVSLRFSNWIAVDYFLSKYLLNSSLNRLESLVLHEMKSQTLIPILAELSSIPQLYSLTATTIGTVRKLYKIHELIFALPVLKYCNTTFQWHMESFSFSDFRSKTSSISYFVSKSTYNIKSLPYLLQYLPKLVHLSINTSSNEQNTLGWSPTIVNELTYLRLQHSVGFDHLEMFISNLFHRIQILRVSSNTNMNASDAKRWQRLISSHLPHLHTFDLQHFGQIIDLAEYDRIHNEFNSSFYWKRKWFFIFQYYTFRNNLFMFFYSQTQSSNIHDARSVRDIIIADSLTTIDLQSSRLTFFALYNPMVEISSLNQFFRTISCSQLEKLTVTGKLFNMDHVIQLLNLSLRIKILTLRTYIFSRIQCNNEIQRIIIQDSLTYEDVQDLIITFPQFETLEMKVKENNLEAIVRFLLKYSYCQKFRLYLIVIHDAHFILVNRLYKLMEREELVQRYSIEFLSDTLYLRW
ncbi:hypothetical protein I4U23_020043 [Adineta vaga]|nr:hypothetical protein I4U23_020043 [Adineta vaga]